MFEGHPEVELTSKPKSMETLKKTTYRAPFDSAYEKKALYQNVHTLSTKTTMGQLFGIILDI